jgi:hypothetical protein
MNELNYGLIKINSEIEYIKNNNNFNDDYKQGYIEALKYSKQFIKDKNKTIQIVNNYFNELLNKDINILSDKELVDILKYIEITQKNILNEISLRNFIKDLPNEKNN